MLLYIFTFKLFLSLELKWALVYNAYLYHSFFFFCNTIHHLNRFQWTQMKNEIILFYYLFSIYLVLFLFTNSSDIAFFCIWFFSPMTHFDVILILFSGHLLVILFAIIIGIVINLPCFWQSNLSWNQFSFTITWTLLYSFIPALYCYYWLQLYMCVFINTNTYLKLLHQAFFIKLFRKYKEES